MFKTKILVRDIDKQTSKFYEVNVPRYDDLRERIQDILAYGPPHAYATVIACHEV